MNDDEKEMYDKLRRTQDFRDVMLEFVAETRTIRRADKDATDRWRGKVEARLDGIDTRLSTGAACVAGARHAERLDGHDRELKALKRPARRTALLVGSSAGGAGIIVVILNWLADNWDKIWGGK